MKKIVLVIFLVFILAQNIYAMSVLKKSAPEELYHDWKFRLMHASRDSVTVKYVIQSEARKLLKKKTSDAQYYGLQGLILSEADATEIEKISEKIIKDFPASEAAFNIAKNDFFDQIYPHWDDDFEKVIIIEELISKYSQTNWRRTMYQYLAHSLAEVKDDDLLVSYLHEWRKNFSNDYLGWYYSARFTQKLEPDSTLHYAQKAYDLSKNASKIAFYPEGEWQLEKNSATIVTGYLYGSILIDKGELSKAESILKTVLSDNDLTIDDETTTGRIDYALAKLYKKRNMKDEAIEYCCNALRKGDSRNVYTKAADSLLYELAELDKKRMTTLQYCRLLNGYNDVSFNDVTTKAGLAGISGNRVAWGDFDNDGWEDFLLSGAGKLFKNFKGKNFVDVTEDVFHDDISFGGALWGDLDNDGDLDIVTKDPEAVWINIDFHFHKLLNESDFEDNHISTEGMALGDIDRDGNLDLYLANYEKNGEYFADQLLLGLGNGSFKDVTERSRAFPEDMINRAGRGVNMGDFDNDSDTDIFVSNYRLNRNYFFINQGNGRLREEAELIGIAGEETDGWWGHTIGSEWGDFDNDGDLDLVTANLAHPRYIDFSNPTMLYENSGAPDFDFKDIRRSANIRYEETHSEPSWGDVNNDGYLDLYFTSVYEGRRSFLYLNNGDKTFREATWLSGTRHFNGWGSAFCDFDKDGDLDLLVAGGNIQLLKNDTKNDNNWLEIQVKPTVGSDGIGTRLELEGRDWVQIREVQGGKGTTNQHSLVQHFGLGSHKSGMRIKVHFPSGITRPATIQNVNHRYIIEEGL